jgi:hypothetical protein
MKKAAVLATAAAIVCTIPGYAQAPKLKTVPFADGTGSIGVAPGFRVGGVYRGAIQCNGPDGAWLNLGTPWAMISPGSSLTTLPTAATSAIAHPSDLSGALREVLAKNVKARLLSLNARPAPPAIPGAPAAYFLYEYEQNGRRFTALGYFTALVYDNEQWQLYSSAVGAPKEVFIKKLPTMMAMWKSWRPNGKPPLAGSESAKIDEIIRDRMDSTERMQKEFRKLL